MERLRKLRIAFKYTQKDLAKMLDVTQQTIGRWETGKAEPSITALKDLAAIFSTTTSDLIGKNSKKIRTNYSHLFAKAKNKGIKIDGFWGHLGLLQNGKSLTRWYPITLGEAEQFSRMLPVFDQSKENWFTFETLNNRLILFNLAGVKRVWLLDDNCDQPDENDWEISWDGDQGYPSVIYQGIVDSIFDKEEYVKNYSHKLKQLIQEIIHEHAFNEDNVCEKILYTHILFSDGSSTSYQVEEIDLSEIVYYCTSFEAPKIVRLNDNERFESYYPSASLYLIDMPLDKYKAGCEEIYEDDDIS